LICNLLGWQSKMGVDVEGFHAAALEEATVKQNIPASAFEMVRRSGNGLCGALKVQTNSHASPSLVDS